MDFETPHELHGAYGKWDRVIWFVEYRVGGDFVFGLVLEGGCEALAVRGE